MGCFVPSSEMLVPSFLSQKARIHVVASAPQGSGHRTNKTGRRCPLRPGVKLLSLRRPWRRVSPEDHGTEDEGALGIYSDVIISEHSPVQLNQYLSSQHFGGLTCPSPFLRAKAQQTRR